MALQNWTPGSQSGFQMLGPMGMQGAFNPIQLFSIKFLAFFLWELEDKGCVFGVKQKYKVGNYSVNFKSIILGPKVNTFYQNYPVFGR